MCLSNQDIPSGVRIVKIGSEQKTQVRRIIPAKPEHYRIAAVHEAGHAVARLLTAGELGYELEQVVSCIDMGWREKRGPRGDRMEWPMGSTWGPSLSKAMQIAATEFQKAYYDRRDSAGYETETYWPTTFKLARAAGVDIERWVRARTFQEVSGSIAEAVITNGSFADIWKGSGYQGKRDREHLVWLARQAGVSVPKVTSTVTRMAAVAAYLMDNRKVWVAILAVADQVPDSGTIHSGKIISAVKKVVSFDELATLFGRATDEVNRLGQDLRLGKVIQMKTANGSTMLIQRCHVTSRGGALRKKVRPAPVHQGAASPVLIETVCRALRADPIPSRDRLTSKRS